MPAIPRSGPDASFAHRPRAGRPYRLPYSRILASLGFVGANLIVYWSGWRTESRLFLAVAVGFILLAISHATGARRGRHVDWRAAAWIAPWLIRMAIISYLGQFDGREVIPFWWDIAIVTAFSLIIFPLARSLALPVERVAAYVQDFAAWRPTSSRGE